MTGALHSAPTHPSTATDAIHMLFGMADGAWGSAASLPLAGGGGNRMKNVAASCAAVPRESTGLVATPSFSLRERALDIVLERAPGAGRQKALPAREGHRTEIFLLHFGGEHLEHRAPVDP